MGASVRPARTFQTLDGATQARVRKNLATLSSKGASDDEIESYLRDDEGLAPDDPAPAPKASAADLLAAPLAAIPGGTTATGVVGGLMDAAGNLLHGRPADLGGSVKRGIAAQSASLDRAKTIAGGYPAAALEAATVFGTAGLGAPAAAAGAAEEANAGRSLVQRVLASRGATNAAKGAAVAGAYRAGAPTDETLADRMRETAYALPAGAALGMALPGAVDAGARVARKFAGPAEERAAALIQRTMQRAGVTPEGLVTSATAGEFAPASVLADQMGRSGRRLTRYTESVPSSGSEKVAAFLEQRGRDRPERLTKAAEEAIGSTRGNVLEQQRALEDARNTAARTNYDAARGTPPIDDEAILAAIADDPVLSEAHARASRIVARANKTDAVPLRGEAGFHPQNIATLDLMKRTVDDVIQSGEAGGSSVGRYEASLSKQRLVELLDQVDNIRPEYKTARGKFAKDIVMEEALESGQRTFRPGTMPEQVADDMARAGDAAPYYRQGAMRDLYGRTEADDRLGNRSLNFLQKTSTGQKLDALAPTRENADALRKRIAQEVGMRETEGAVLGNSQTARLQQDIADAEGLPIADIVTSAATGGLTGVARMAGRRALARYGQGINEKTADKLGEYLLTGRNGPEDYQALLDLLASFEQRKGAGQAARSPLLRRVAGQAAGRDR